MRTHKRHKPTQGGPSKQKENKATTVKGKKTRVLTMNKPSVVSQPVFQIAEKKNEKNNGMA